MPDMESSEQDREFAKVVAEVLFGIVKFPAYRGPHPEVGGLRSGPHPDDGWRWAMKSPATDGGVCYVNVAPARNTALAHMLRRVARENETCIGKLVSVDGQSVAYTLHEAARRLEGLR